MVLSHDTGNGKRKITLPAKTETLHESRKAFDTGSIHEVSTGGYSIIVSVIPNYLGFKYNLTCDGKRIPSHLERVNQVQDSMSFSVTSTAVESVAGSKVVYYVLETKSSLQGGAVVATTPHRFSDFIELQATVRSMFGSSHLSKSIPPMPGKLPKMGVDHFDVKFIEDRRTALDSYMQAIGKFPGIMDVPGFEDFLGHDINGV